MITEEEVLRAIVKHRKANGRTMHFDVINELSIDDITLIQFNKILSAKGYITTTMEDITITSLGMSVYNDTTLTKKAQKSIYEFSKFTFQRLIDIFTGIVIGIVVAYIVYHFGWQ